MAEIQAAVNTVKTPVIHRRATDDDSSPTELGSRLTTLIATGVDVVEGVVDIRDVDDLEIRAYARRSGSSADGLTATLTCRAWPDKIPGATDHGNGVVLGVHVVTFGNGSEANGTLLYNGVVDTGFYCSEAELISETSKYTAVNLIDVVGGASHARLEMDVKGWSYFRVDVSSKHASIGRVDVVCRKMRKA